MIDGSERVSESLATEKRISSDEKNLNDVSFGSDENDDKQRVLSFEFSLIQYYLEGRSEMKEQRAALFVVIV